MRLIVSFSAPSRPLPFDHLDALRGVFHRWAQLSRAQHDGLSLYGFSWLHGARATRDGLRFPQGATWHIGAFERELCERLRENICSDIQEAHDVMWGMRVVDVEEEAPRNICGRVMLRTLSPVWLKADRAPDQRCPDFVLPGEARADELLVRALKNKLDASGIGSEGARCGFDLSQSFKTKMARIKGAGHRAAACPVWLEGTSAQIEAVLSWGMGHSNGLGFGFLN